MILNLTKKLKLKMGKEALVGRDIKKGLNE